MPVTIQLPPDLETRLRREAARHGIEPEAYVARALEQHLRGAAANGNGADAAPAAGHALSAAEARLLQQINLGLPQEVWARYRDLRRKRDDGTLTPEEREELIRLSDRTEEANARRMEHLAELARLRGVGLQTLMRDLGIAGAANG